MVGNGFFAIYAYFVTLIGPWQVVERGIYKAFEFAPFQINYFNQELLIRLKLVTDWINNTALDGAGGRNAF